MDQQELLLLVGLATFFIGGFLGLYVGIAMKKKLLSCRTVQLAEKLEAKLAQRDKQESSLLTDMRGHIVRLGTQYSTDFSKSLVISQENMESLVNNNMCLIQDSLIKLQSPIRQKATTAKLKGKKATTVGAVKALYSGHKVNQKWFTTVQVREKVDGTTAAISWALRYLVKEGYLEKKPIAELLEDGKLKGKMSKKGNGYARVIEAQEVVTKEAPLPANHGDTYIHNINQQTEMETTDVNS